MKIVIKTLNILVILTILIFPIFNIFTAQVLAADTITPAEAATEYNPSNMFTTVGGPGPCNQQNSLSGFIKIPFLTESDTGIQALIGSVIAGITNLVIGCKNYALNTDAQPVGLNITNGVLGSFSSSLGSIYASPPTSLVYQVRDTIQRIDPVKSAFAESFYLPQQQTGASILTLIKSIHSSITSLIYIIYVFIFIVIAFSILFRNKLAGQNYVAIVSAIPRIIISLLLVVFSYSIAGFIIDIGNIGMSIVYNISVNQIKLNNPATNTTSVSDEKTLAEINGNSPQGRKFLTDLYPFSPTMSVFQIFGFSEATTLSKDDGINVNLVQPNLGSGATVVNGIASTLLILGESATGGGLQGLLIFILSIGALLSMFKLFFALLKDFITILFYPLLAPVQFALLAIPGQEKGAINWFRTMLGSVLSFVAVYCVFMLIALLGRQYLTSGENSWVPWLLGFQTAPSVSFITSLAAYGLFVISPSIPDLVKSAISSDTGSMNKLGSQISEATRKAASYATLGIVK